MNFIKKKLNVLFLIYKHPVLIVNFIYQRVFRINSQCKFSIHFTSQVYNPENLFMEGRTLKYFWNAPGCYFHALNGIHIGKDTIIAPGTKIVSVNHDINDLNRLVINDSNKIVIGKSCWLGANSVILPGVVLGDKVIVAAGSVVTKSFSENSIVAGVPAKLLRMVE
jgi:acetyltransferase-like isoleucine patch superfamily enzyme